MMKYLIILIFVIPTEISSQNHTVGFNIGNANESLTTEAYYSFNIYRVYSKIDYAFSFGHNSSDYQYLHHIGSIFGFQTNSENKFIFHVGMGVRFLTATNYPRIETNMNRTFIKDQWGSILNVGASYNIKNQHFINFDNYLSNPHYNGGGRYSSSSNGYFEARFMIGYAYRFAKKKRD